MMLEPHIQKKQKVLPQTQNHPLCNIDIVDSCDFKETQVLDFVYLIGFNLAVTKYSPSNPNQRSSHNSVNDISGNFTWNVTQLCLLFRTTLCYCRILVAHFVKAHKYFSLGWMIKGIELFPICAILTQKYALSRLECVKILTGMQIRVKSF